MSKVIAKVIGVLALSAGMASTAFAGTWTAKPTYGFTPTVSAPEIDPASALSGLTLLLGGLAVVRGGRAKK